MTPCTAAVTTPSPTSVSDTMMTPTILTSSGRYFNLLAPRSIDVSIGEIAHALSHICRFTGHTKQFYSVAEHSYHASFLVPPEHAMAALLHDAAEAYIGDVASPLKALLPDYKAIEARVEAAVFGYFGLHPVLPPCVKTADLIMLATEQRDLMPDHSDDWAILKGITPLPQPIIPMPPQTARYCFLDRYFDLANMTKARAAT